MRSPEKTTSKPLRASARRSAAAITATGMLLLAGCGGGGGGGEGGVADRSGDASRAEGATGAQGLRQDGPAPGSGDTATERQDGRAGQAGQVSQAAFENRERIYTASLTVRVDEADSVDSAGDEAERIVTTAGGYVHAQELETSGVREKTTTATLTLKVPPQQYRDVLAQLQDLGQRVDLETSTEDVTGEVADVESRIASAQASIDRLRALLERAGSVGEVIEVEQELADREAELESLQGRLKALEAKTSYATVTLELKPTKKAPVVRDTDPPGFLAGLYGGWGALTVVATWLAAALGATLPFLVILALAGAAAWWTRGQVRRRRGLPVSATSGPGTDAPV